MASLTIYVGPYLRCINSKKKATRKEMRCVRCETRIPTDNYCSKCGGAVEWAPVAFDVDGVDTGLLAESVECGLQLLTHQGGRAIEGVDFWVTNLVSGPGAFYSRDRERDMKPEHVPMVAGETKVFEEKFADEIAKVISAYGMEWVGIFWGVLTEWD